MQSVKSVLVLAVWTLLLTPTFDGVEPVEGSDGIAAAPMPRPQQIATRFPAEDVVIASIILDPPAGEDSDAAPTLQRAIDQAADAGGAVVFLKAGHYPIRTRLVLREGVILRGDWAPIDPDNGARGTVLDIYAGREDAEGEAVITMERGTGVRDLSIWYPEQRVEAPIPYAWTLRTSKTVTGNNTTVMNVTLINPYQGIKIGPEANELHTIRNVQITPLKLGISVDSTTDIGRLKDVAISASFWADSRLPGCPASAEERNALRKVMTAAATGVDVGRSDWEYIHQVAVDGCARGFVFRRGVRGLTNAVMYGCRTAHCGVGLECEHLNAVGLSATACSFHGTDACVSAPESFSTIVQFHTCSFSGPVENCVRLEGQGLLTFQNCTFEGWSADAILARCGMLSAMGCQFRGPAFHVAMGPDVKRARLLGNTFAGKPDVRNNAPQADVQISHLPIDFARPDLSPHHESPFPRPASDRVVVATDFGVHVDAEDNGPALQKALDAAAEAGGGTVYVPAGNYAFASEITVPSNVELRGIFDVPHHTISAGSVLMPNCGKGREDGTPFLQLSPGSGIRGITVWYPEQHPAEPAAFPWTVRSLGPKCWLVDVTLGNSYQAVDFWTHPSTGHVIRYLAGGPFRRGLWLSKCDGDGWVEDVQFNPHYALRPHKELPRPDWDRSAGGKLIDYQREHLEAMIFGSCRREHMRGNFLYAAMDGLAFRDDNGGTNARVFLQGADTASRAVVLEHAGPDGIELINTQLVPLGNWVQAAIVTTPEFDGSARFFNSQVWAGPRTAQLDGAGSVLIQQINTVSGGVVAANGHLVLQNANFQADLDPHVAATGKNATVEIVGAMSRGGVFRASSAAGGRLTAPAPSAPLPVAPSRPAAPNDVPAAEPPWGILIEAEDYRRKAPDDDAFAGPAWLDRTTDYRLPAWYDENRVQAHTRLGAAYMTKDIFLSAAAGFREMGADVFVRHIQAHTQGAWWPSKAAAIHPLAENRNLAKEIIDDAHRAGCRLIVYHVHMYDRLLGAEHPDWICRDAGGEPIGHHMMPFMCYNSPYPDLYLQRALELVDLGADGLYFDFVHMPKTGCWCDNCRREFKRATGLDHPQRADAADPVWRKLAEFNDGVIERTFLKWRESIHRRNPQCVMLISSHLWSGMTDHHLNNRLFRIADSVKMEFSIPIRKGPNRIFSLDPSLAAPEPDVRLALGYTLARDAADGRPAHIWTHGLLDETSTLYAAAGMVAHGCIANLDVPESTIPNPMFKRAFELGDRVSPCFAGTAPARWAAVHYAEQARDELAPDESRQWKEVLYPLYGTYRTLLRARVPVGVVTDSQLEQGSLDGYRVLFLPAADRLTPRMKAAVEAFESGGGLVVEQRATWQWHAPDGGLERAAAAFTAEVSLQLASAPIRVLGGPDKMHAVSFAHRLLDRMTIALANDFSWVYTGQEPDAEKIAELTKPPQPCRGVTIGIRREAQPKRVFDAVSGKTLAAESRPPGLTIKVPEFDYLAVVVVEF